MKDSLKSLFTVCIFLISSNLFAGKSCGLDDRLPVNNKVSDKICAWGVCLDWNKVARNSTIDRRKQMHYKKRSASTCAWGVCLDWSRVTSYSKKRRCSQLHYKKKSGSNCAWGVCLDWSKVAGNF